MAVQVQVEIGEKDPAVGQGQRRAVERQEKIRHADSM